MKMNLEQWNELNRDFIKYLSLQGQKMITDGDNYALLLDYDNAIDLDEIIEFLMEDYGEHEITTHYGETKTGHFHTITVRAIR